MNEATTERLLKNYYNARKSWESWCYLNNIDLKIGKPEIRNYADTNELLFYARYLFSKDLHIELYKIIKDNRSTIDNIFKLLRNSENSKAKAHIEKLNDFKNELKLITDTRDKFFAHLDSNYKDFLSNFKVDNYYSIFELIEQAIIILGKEKQLLDVLKKIPSRDEFELKL